MPMSSARMEPGLFKARLRVSAAAQPPGGSAVGGILGLPLLPLLLAGDGPVLSLEPLGSSLLSSSRRLGSRPTVELAGVCRATTLVGA